MLLAILIHAEPLEGQVASRSKLRLNRSLVEDGRFHSEVGHTILHDIEFEGDNSGNFDGAAEGDLSVALYSLSISPPTIGMEVAHVRNASHQH